MKIKAARAIYFVYHKWPWRSLCTSARHVPLCRLTRMFHYGIECDPINRVV